MAKLPTLDKWEKSELERHEKFVSGFIRESRELLAEHPIRELTPRWQDLLNRLEAAFRTRTCPPHVDLLLAGLAEDDYRPQKVKVHINANDPTPRHYWQGISPELLRACEDCLSYLEPLAFCYLIPAYLRLIIQRPYYLCTDSIFFYLCYKPDDGGRKRLAPLSPAEREVVTDILNERRCEALFDDVDIFDSDLLPWEYEQMVAECAEPQPVRYYDKYHFAEKMALEYAEKTGFLDKKKD